MRFEVGKIYITKETKKVFGGYIFKVLDITDNIYFFQTVKKPVGVTVGTFEKTKGSDEYNYLLKASSEYIQIHKYLDKLKDKYRNN